MTKINLNALSLWCGLFGLQMATDLEREFFPFISGFWPKFPDVVTSSSDLAVTTGYVPLGSNICPLGTIFIMGISDCNFGFWSIQSPGNY